MVRSGDDGPRLPRSSNAYGDWHWSTRRISEKSLQQAFNLRHKQIHTLYKALVAREAHVERSDSTQNYQHFKATFAKFNVQYFEIGPKRLLNLPVDIAFKFPLALPRIAEEIAIIILIAGSDRQPQNANKTINGNCWFSEYGHGGWPKLYA